MLRVLCCSTHCVSHLPESVINRVLIVLVTPGISAYETTELERVITVHVHVLEETFPSCKQGLRRKEGGLIIIIIIIM